MLLRHYRTLNQCVCILWKWIGIAWVDIIIDVFNVECVLRESTSTGNGWNINVEPLERTGIICWNKYTGLLTSSNNSNHFCGLNSWNLILLIECTLLLSSFLIQTSTRSSLHSLETGAQYLKAGHQPQPLPKTCLSNSVGPIPY